MTQEKDIQQWCQALSDCFDLGETLYVGQSSAAVTRVLSASGVSIVGNGSDSFPSAARRWDTLILEQSGLEACRAFSPDDFQKQFGTPRQILVVISTMNVGPSLPEASRWLWSIGYSRNFVTGIWVDDRTFISAYESGTLGIDSAIESYEAEWWRQAQTSQKRRQLLVEYMDELIHNLLGSRLGAGPEDESASDLKRRLVEAESRWEAFQNSRTGKILQLLQKIRRLGRA